MGPAYTLSSNSIIYLHLVKVWILWGHYLSGMTLVIWENDKGRACQMLPALSDVTLPDISRKWLLPYRDSRTKLLPYTNFYLKVFAQIEVLTTFLHTTSTCQMLPALSDVTLPDIKRMVIAININICNIKLHVFCLNLFLKGKVVACNSLYSV